MHVRPVVIRSQVHRGTSRDLADPDIPVVPAGHGAVRDTARMGRPGGIGLDAHRGGDLSRPRRLREGASVFEDKTAGQEAEGAANECARQTRKRKHAAPSMNGGRRVFGFAPCQILLAVLELVAQVESGLEAPRRVFFEASFDDPREVPWNLEVDVGQGPGPILEDRRHHTRGAVSAEGKLAREQLIEDDAESEDVGTMVDRLSFRLLRGHVPKSAHEHAFLSRGRRYELADAGATDLAVELRETEVEYLELTLFGQHDVRRLQVPVRDPALMRGRDAVRERDRNLEKPLRREPVSRQNLGERLPAN